MRTYRSEKREYRVGCGLLRVTVAFRGDESFHCLLSALDNHDNDCGCAYSNALADTLTFALRRRFTKDKEGKDVSEIGAIIKGLDNHICGKSIVNEKKVKSCPDAIAEALKEAFAEEIKDKKNNEISTK